MTPEEMSLTAARLDQLQSVENDGRGISCVRAIVHYLRRGELSSAIAIRRIEGDKTRSYPKVEKALTEIFGCRMHAVKDCENCYDCHRDLRLLHHLSRG